VVVARPQWGWAQAMAAGWAFLHLACWSMACLTAENLRGALAIYLIFGALHAVVPVVLSRRRPENPAVIPRQAAPWIGPLVLLMMLLPVFHLSPVPMVIWAAILLVDLLVIGLAVATGAVIPVLASLVLTLGVAAMWLLRVPAQVDSLLPFLGVITGFAAVFALAGKWLQRGMPAAGEGQSPEQLAASVLPVWLLLIPRDYLSSYMKIGTIAALVIGVIVVNPELKMPALTQYIGGGGPIIPGKLFPFLFVTIACGAISGFHALVASGTTPKLLNRESDARIIGYGGMLMEGLVGVVALIAACSLNPGDYFAINLTPEKFAQLGIPAVNLETLSREVGEVVAGRPGGAVSLAVGFAQIFTGLPGLERLMSFWYHFAIMFEALFILTTIDAGTRVMRFMVQEFGGRIWKPMERTDWLPANVLATTIVVCSWGYFLWTGSISTIWPMFGTANQLLAAVALAVSTSVIINARKERYAWITIVPMVFVAATTLTAGILNITDNFWPLTQSPSTRIQGYVNSTMTLVMIYCAIMVMVEALKRWYAAIVHGRYEVKQDESHSHPGGDPPFLGCC